MSELTRRILVSEASRVLEPTSSLPRFFSFFLRNSIQLAHFSEQALLRNRLLALLRERCERQSPRLGCMPAVVVVLHYCCQKEEAFKGSRKHEFHLAGRAISRAVHSLHFRRSVGADALLPREHNSQVLSSREAAGHTSSAFLRVLRTRPVEAKPQGKHGPDLSGVALVRREAEGGV